MTTALIGADLTDFRTTPKHAIRLVAESGFNCVEIPTVDGELSPPNLAASGRRHLARLVESHGLKLSALVADYPALRWTDPAASEQRAALTLQIIDLAADMNVPIVTSCIRSPCHPDTGRISPIALEALTRIADRADARGITLALRATGDDDPIPILLDALKCPAVAACLDPAATMMAGTNPATSLPRYIENVKLVHVRDGFAGQSNQEGIETKFGQGDVDFITILAMLDAAGYHNPFIVRMRTTAHPANDLLTARKALQRLLHEA